MDAQKRLVRGLYSLTFQQWPGFMFRQVDERSGGNVAAIHEDVFKGSVLHFSCFRLVVMGSKLALKHGHGFQVSETRVRRHGVERGPVQCLPPALIGRVLRGLRETDIKRQALQVGK